VIGSGVKSKWKKDVFKRRLAHNLKNTFQEDLLLMMKKRKN